MNRIGDYLESDIALCLQKNEDEYLERFRDLPRRKFNFCAAFFAGNWFAYRLMVKDGLLLWLADGLVTCGMFSIALTMVIRMALNYDYVMFWVMLLIIIKTIAVFIAVGYFADEIYLNRLKCALEEANRKGATEPATESEGSKLKEAFGVSKGCAIIVALVCGSLTQYGVLPLAVKIAEFLGGI